MERFWQKVARGAHDQCWPWSAARQKNGYGVFREGGKGSRMVRAHRKAYELAVGPIPARLEVAHVCDNRACCNPSHLRPMTHADNMTDMFRKGRHNGPRKAGYYNS